jgi:hypothetical protein
MEGRAQRGRDQTVAEERDSSADETIRTVALSGDETLRTLASSQEGEPESEATYRLHRRELASLLDADEENTPSTVEEKTPDPVPEAKLQITAPLRAVTAPPQSAFHTPSPFVTWPPRNSLSPFATSSTPPTPPPITRGQREAALPVTQASAATRPQWLAITIAAAVLGLGLGMMGRRLPWSDRAPHLSASELASLCASFTAPQVAPPPRAMQAPPLPLPVRPTLPPSSEPIRSPSSPSAPAAPTVAPSALTAPALAWLSTEQARPHHRIFVDGKVVGETPAVVAVPCGSHKVKLGSAGTSQSVDAPCGVRTPVTDK